MKRQNRAYLYAISAVLLWSTVASAFKLTLQVLRPVDLLFYSTLISCLLLGVAAFAGGTIARIRQWDQREWLSSIFLGFLNPFFYYHMLFRAYALLPAQEAQPLNYTWPIVLVLLSALVLRQRIKAVTLLAMLLSFAGVFVISTRGDLFSLQFTDAEGVVLAVGSSIVWATYWIFNVKSRAEPRGKLFMNFVFGSVYVTVYYFGFAVPVWPGIAGFTGSVYVALFEMGITFLLWMSALKLTSSTARVSNLVFLSPFLSLLVIHFVVGEEIYPSTVTGLVLIVAGIVMQRISDYRDSDLSEASGDATDSA